MAQRPELFRAAVVTGRGAGFLLSGGAARGAPSTIHRVENGKSVKRWKVPYALHSCCAITRPTVGLVAIAAEDRFVVLDDDGLHEGHVYRQCTPRPKRVLYGQLSAVGSVAGQAWAVGLDGVAWRLDSLEGWTTFEDASVKEVHLACVGGVQTPLACGDLGATFRIGAKWKRLKPAPLHAVWGIAANASDRTAIAGRDHEREGSVCVLEKERWKTLEWAVDEKPEQLRSVAWVKGQLFASGADGVFHVERGRLRPVELPKGVTTWWLAGGDELWSIGERDVLRFDGKRWKRITTT